MNICLYNSSSYRPCHWPLWPNNWPDLRGILPSLPISHTPTVRTAWPCHRWFLHTTPIIIYSLWCSRVLTSVWFSFFFPLVYKKLSSTDMKSEWAMFRAGAVVRRSLVPVETVTWQFKKKTFWRSYTPFVDEAETENLGKVLPISQRSLR